MALTVTPFLMFEGRAEEAMNFYVSLFADGIITELTKYGPGQPGPEGTIMKAAFVVAGQTILCSDSFVKHAFTFTPSISLFVTCEDEAQIRKLTAELGNGGGELMPLANYGFSTLFSWVNDRFGVSWQLMLP